MSDCESFGHGPHKSTWPIQSVTRSKCLHQAAPGYEIFFCLQEDRSAAKWPESDRHLRIRFHCPGDPAAEGTTGKVWQVLTLQLCTLLDEWQLKLPKFCIQHSCPMRADVQFSSFLMTSAVQSNHIQRNLTRLKAICNNLLAHSGHVNVPDFSHCSISTCLSSAILHLPDTSQPHELCHLQYMFHIQLCRTSCIQSAIGCR